MTIQWQSRRQLSSILVPALEPLFRVEKWLLRQRLRSLSNTSTNKHVRFFLPTFPEILKLFSVFMIIFYFDSTSLTVLCLSRYSTRHATKVTAAPFENQLW